MSLIRFESVSKSFGKTTVLHDVSLDVPAASFCVILGPSGCGKSTLLRLLAGLERLNAGEIWLDGKPVTQVAAKDRDVAIVFQNYALYPHMTVAENLGYSLKVHGIKKAERGARISEVARLLQLADLLERRPGQLSGGQRQRVAMGRAIIRSPKVFLFDEPLSNLDAKLRTQMRVEIKSLHQRQGVTSLFVTHDQMEAMTLADQLVVMNAGRIEQIGAPTQVYSHPSSTFVAGFLGTPPMNLLNAEVSSGGNALVLQNGARYGLSASLPPGPVIAGIRPEHIEIHERDGWPLPVHIIEELGNGRLVHAHLGNDMLSALVPEQLSGLSQEKLRFRLPAGALQLFDAPSGRAIASVTLSALEHQEAALA